MRKPYQTYAYYVKDKIIQEKNPRLFPELNIPLSTARHWIRKGLTRQVGNSIIAETCELAGSQALIETCCLVIKLLGDEVDLSNLTPQEVDSFRRKLLLQDKLLMKIVGPKLRHRIRQAVTPCFKSIDGRCIRRFSSQLTSVEVKIMKTLVTSRKYAYMSISSLSLLATRDELLLCSSHTW